MDRYHRQAIFCIKTKYKKLNIKENQYYQILNKIDLEIFFIV